MPAGHGAAHGAAILSLLNVDHRDDAAVRKNLMPPLIRAVEVLPPGKWPAGTAVDRLVLDYDERHRRRLRYVAAGGTPFLLDLPRATILRAGDGLRLEDGRIVCVEAAPEQLVEVTVPDGGAVTNSAALIRLAWHIGNRHLPAQLEPQRILIRQDAVIENMLGGLGATIKHVLEPFTPEAGAYDHASAPTVHHAHDGHDHSHGHEHGGHHHDD
jgi:urease accessory protein